MLMSRKPRNAVKTTEDDQKQRSAADEEKLDPRDWDELGDWLNHDWRELRANGARYVGARFDLARLKSSRAAAHAILAGLAAVLVVTLTVVGAIYGVRGSAEVLERLYDGRRWASDLTICALLLGSVFFAARIVARKVLAFVEGDVRKRYEIRQAEEAERTRDEERRRTEAESK